MRRFATGTIYLAILCGFSACRSRESAKAGTGTTKQHAVPAPSSSASSASGSAASASAAPSASRGPDWEKVKIEDEAPLCVFADYDQQGKANFITDVHKQTLKANSTVVLGTFAPGCVNETCDALPMLGCWIDDGDSDTIVVHSRLSYEHKRGTVCTQNCRPIVAGCETRKLKAGKYTIKYGSKTYSLRIPNVMRHPCFEER